MPTTYRNTAQSCLNSKARARLLSGLCCSCSLRSEPADNHARQLAQFLYGTLPAIMNNRIYPILLLLILTSCSEFDEAEYIRKDRSESKKLMGTIFSNDDDDYLTLDCIREKDYHMQSILDREDKMISRHLGLKTNEQLTTIFNLNENFKWKRNNAHNKIILTEEELRVFREETDPDNIDFRNLSKCPKGYLTISKPIFNEDYNKAIVQIGQVCGFLCGHGEYRLYKLKDEKWELEEIIGFWES